MAFFTESRYSINFALKICKKISTVDLKVTVRFCQKNTIRPGRIINKEFKMLYADWAIMDTKLMATHQNVRLLH
jgi:hypothetical protein